VLYRPTLSVAVRLVNFSRWKWACKTRCWGQRPRWDRDLRFSVRDETDTETETFPDFLETETFWKYVSRPRLRDRDFIPAKMSDFIYRPIRLFNLRRVAYTLLYIDCLRDLSRWVSTDIPAPVIKRTVSNLTNTNRIKHVNSLSFSRGHHITCSLLHASVGLTSVGRPNISNQRQLPTKATVSAQSSWPHYKVDQITNVEKTQLVVCSWSAIGISFRLTSAFSWQFCLILKWTRAWWVQLGLPIRPTHTFGAFDVSYIVLFCLIVETVVG